jgi:hypothetical protein
MTLVAQAEAGLDTTLGRYRAYLSSGRAALGEMFGGDVEVSSSGAWVHTEAGRRLLNCGGYGVLLMGARHPRVIAEVTRQLNTNPVATRLLLEPEVARAAAELISVTPPGLTRVHFADQLRGTGAGQFRGVPWIPWLRDGVPLLIGAMCWLGCEFERRIPMGDHELVLAPGSRSHRGRWRSIALLFWPVVLGRSWSEGVGLMTEMKQVRPRYIGLFEVLT